MNEATNNLNQPTAPGPEGAVLGDHPMEEPAEQPTSGPTPISAKKLAANRANAQKSTGPITPEGKKISSKNAVQHGLLARSVPITTGDYREDAVEFLELLDSLLEEYQPVTQADIVDVEIIAQCIWKKIRRARYESAVTRRETLRIRHHVEARRDRAFEEAWEWNGPEVLEEMTRGIQAIIDLMEDVKRQVRELPFTPVPTPVPEALSESLEWLTEAYPDDFASNDGIHEKDGSRVVYLHEAYAEQVIAAIDEHLTRLRPLWYKIESIEGHELEAEIEVAALPSAVLEAKVGRYAKENDGEQERAEKRLERRRAARRASGRFWPRATS